MTSSNILPSLIKIPYLWDDYSTTNFVSTKVTFITFWKEREDVSSDDSKFCWAPFKSLLILVNDAIFFYFNLKDYVTNDNWKRF